MFRWLPIRCVNDLVHGSWWFVWASAFSSVINFFPLLNIFLAPSQRLWPITYSGYLSTSTQCACYVMLIGCGVLFTFASLLLVRVFDTPPPPPLFRSYMRDDLLSSWCFFAGTLPTIPITVLNAVYVPEYVAYVYNVSIAAAVLGTVAMLAVTVMLYPGMKTKDYVAPRLRACLRVCSNHPHVQRHAQTDWLVACWAFLLVSFLGFVGCLAALVNYCSKHNRRGIYDFITASVDLLLIVIGSLYFVAGSYDVEDQQAVAGPQVQVEATALPGSAATPAPTPSPSEGKLAAEAEHEQTV